MFREEFEEDLDEGPVYNIEVIGVLIQLGQLSNVVRDYPSTTNLNAHLSTLTDATPLVPVFVNDTCEDIVKWAEDIEVKELSDYIKRAFDTDSPVSTRAVDDICQDNYVGTVTGEYFKRYIVGLKSVMHRAGIVSKILQQFCGRGSDRTKEDFYDLIEELGITEGLVFDRNCPLEIRKNAIRRASSMICTNVMQNAHLIERPGVVGVIMGCVTLVSSVHMYKDLREGRIVFVTIARYFGGATRNSIKLPKDTSRNYCLPLYILSEYKNIEPELARAFYDEIKFSLMLLEEVYDLNIMKLLRDNPELFGEDVVEVAHLLLD